LHPRIKKIGDSPSRFQKHLSPFFGWIAIQFVNGNEDAGNCWIASRGEFGATGNSRLQCSGSLLRGLALRLLGSGAGFIPLGNKLGVQVRKPYGQSVDAASAVPIIEIERHCEQIHPCHTCRRSVRAFKITVTNRQAGFDLDQARAPPPLNFEVSAPILGEVNNLSVGLAIANGLLDIRV
jgi:ferredoxin